jgi:hypothetical protein
MTLYFRSSIRATVEAITQRIKAGSSVVTGPIKLSELRKDPDVVQKRVDDVFSIAARLFLTTMSKEVYRNLERLCDGFGKFKRAEGLMREQSHLRDNGYVRVASNTAMPAWRAEAKGRLKTVVYDEEVRPAGANRPEPFGIPWPPSGALRID